MVLYDPRIAMRFTDYGITIPVLDSRASKIVEFLARKLEAAGITQHEWLVRGVAARLVRSDLERVHNVDFIDRLYSGGETLEKELLKTYELIDSNGEYHRYQPDSAIRPLTDLFQTILVQAAGTYQAACMALESGFCFYLGGGMHHARRDSGSGFCPINDSMIAIARLRAEGRIRRAWIIDTDAHKGDGTAEIAATDPLTDTLSIHMASGWPLDAESLATARKEGRGIDRAPFIPNDVEIPIALNQNNLYVEKLSEGLLQLKEGLTEGRPDIAIVVDGADPYEHDGLESSRGLALSLEQCVERDRLVFDFLRSLSIPSAWLQSGGYGPRSWEPPASFLEHALIELLL